MVILYEKCPDEVWQLSKEKLQRRLYVITGLGVHSAEAMLVTLIHHQDARPKKEIKPKKGAFKADEPFRPRIVLRHTQFKGLIQNVDFELNDLGEITRLK